MTHRLPDDLKLWTIGLALIGLLLFSTQCNPSIPTPTTEVTSPTATPMETLPSPTPIAQVTLTVIPTDIPHPQITGFTSFPSGSVLPGTLVNIQVNVIRHGH